MTLRHEHLLGRPFVHGGSDCYALVRDFYADNFGLALTNYARPDQWWWHGLNLYEDHFRAEGFEAVEDAPRPADAFLVAVASAVANHAGVYLGDGRVLHHFPGRRSEVVPVRGIWRHGCCRRVRHRAVPDLRPPAQEVDLLAHLAPHIRRKLEAAHD